MGTIRSLLRQPISSGLNTSPQKSPNKVVHMLKLFIFICKVMPEQIQAKIFGKNVMQKEEQTFLPNLVELIIYLSTAIQNQT